MESIALWLVAADFGLAALHVFRSRWRMPASILDEVRLLVAILLFAAMAPLFLGIAPS